MQGEPSPPDTREPGPLSLAFLCPPSPSLRNVGRPPATAWSLRISSSLVSGPKAPRATIWPWPAHRRRHCAAGPCGRCWASLRLWRERLCRRAVCREVLRGALRFVPVLCALSSRRLASSRHRVSDPFPSPSSRSLPLCEPPSPASELVCSVAWFLALCYMSQVSGANGS